MGTTADSAASQGGRDALADARTLVLVGRHGRDLQTVLSEGSAAVVACLDGRPDLAALHAGNAAHAAFRAVPGLGRPPERSVAMNTIMNSGCGGMPSDADLLSVSA